LNSLITFISVLLLGVIVPYNSTPCVKNKGKCVVTMNSYIDTDRYAIQQNNVGVDCYMTIGDVDGALHCFRQALAAKLSSELSVLATTEANGEKTLHNHDSHAPEIPAVADEESQQRCVTPEPADFLRSDQLEVFASGATGMSKQALRSIA
jgi:hypothetical protein